MPKTLALLLVSALPAMTALAQEPPQRGGAGTAAAQAEMLALANAQQLVLLDTIFFFTTLENLDDLPSETFNNTFDWINHAGGPLMIKADQGEFRTPRQPIAGWQGPYVTYQPGAIDDAASEYDEGTPLDPWGQPYLFFSPLGLLAPRSQSVTLDSYGDAFDQYTIVSYGPDGVRSGDDLFRTVPGPGLVLPVISSVRVVPSGARASEPFELRIKGYQFGGSQGGGAVLVDGGDLPAASIWSETLVTAPLASIPAVGTEFGLRLSGGQVLSFTGFLVEGAASVGEWQLHDTPAARSD
jgi:hypothetical protein